MNFVTKNSIVFEIIFGLGFIVALIVGQTWQYWGVLASLILLATLYFLSGLQETSESGNVMIIALVKIFGVANAVTVVGILFQLIDLPGHYSLLVVGLVTLIIAVFVSMIMILSNSENSAYLKSKVLRGMAIAIFAALMLLFPGINIVEKTLT